MSHQEVLYWGLRFADWINLCGLVLGPVVAVLVTLWIDGRRKRREQRIQVMRILLTTRHLPGDAGWSLAINLIPVEFNDNKKVMSAWHNYIETVRFVASPENQAEQEKQLSSKQTKLIFEVMKAIGFNLPETDIQTSAYAANGFIARDNLLIGSQRAMIDIAESLKLQTQLMGGGVPPDQAKH